MRELRLNLPAFVVLALLAALATYAADGGFTLEQVLSHPFPEGLTAAPGGGSRIAWVSNDRGRRNIWVAEGPNFTARQLTNYSEDDGQEISALQFVHGGDRLVYVRGGEKNRAGEYPNPTSEPTGVQQTVWTIAWTGGAPQKIDEGDSPAASPNGKWVAYVKADKIWLATLAEGAKPEQLVTRGNDHSPTWSPDGARLAFVSDRGDHQLIAVYDTEHHSVGYVAPSVDSDNFPRWSPDGHWLAFTRSPAQSTDEIPRRFFWIIGRPNPWAIWMANMAEQAPFPAREVWHSPDSLDGSFPYMAGDDVLNWAGGHLVFASEQDGWQHLYSLPATGGNTTLLTPGECEFEHMALTEDRRAIYFSSNCGDIDRRHLWRVAVTGGPPQPVTSGEGIEWSPIPTADGKWLGYMASDAHHAATPFVLATNAAGKEAIPLQAAPEAFPADKLVVPQQVIFPSLDGWKIHGQLFLPPNLHTGERRAAIIFMHGGPVREMLLGWHYMYYYSNSYAMNQFLASRGYIIFSVNYRRGIGYGRAFREAKNSGPMGASEYQDIVGAAQYLAGRPDVDKTRIGLWGGSYGGYLTALGLARNSDLFAAGVDLHGVHDWSNPDMLRSLREAKLPPEIQKMFRESSPIAAVDKWHSPALLIQGDDDRNVPFGQTVDLAARLRQQKVSFEQLVFPDEIHDFLLFRTWLRAYQAGADFFDRHLKSAGSNATQ